MSAYVLNKENIDLLTAATDTILQLNKRYPGSYHLNADTVNLLGKYAGDLHNVYRALYITNVKAYNGRYNDNDKTFPRYTGVIPWVNENNLDTRFINRENLKKACCIFDCYLYQISEDPIDGTPVYNAFQDIHKSLCALLVGKLYDWNGNEQ